MLVLVTGATGFIGSHVADLLLEKGYDVRCTVRKTSNLQWLKDKPVDLFEAPLSDKEALKKAMKDVDYVIHCAGLTAAKNYEGFLKGNVGGTLNMLEAASEAAPGLKRFVHLSSLTAAGPSESLAKPKTEDMPCNPITSYGKSKLAAEAEVIKFSEKLPVTIIRPPAVYGPRDPATLDVFKTIKRGLGPLIGSTPKFASIIHAADLARGTVAAMEYDKGAGEIYNISSNKFFTWEEINEYIKKGLGREKLMVLKIPHGLVLTIAGVSGFFGKFSKKPPVFDYEKGIDFIQEYWICSWKKAENHFGFLTEIPLEEGMKETAQWYISHGWL